MTKLAIISTFCFTYFNYISGSTTAYLKEAPYYRGIKNQNDNVKIRNDGVIVISEHNNFPDIPDINTQIDKSKLNIWTTNREPNNNEIFTRFSFKHEPLFSSSSRQNSKPSQKSANAKTSNRRHPVSLEYKPQQQKQTVHGFGGALTDAVMINLNKLKSESLIQTTKSLYFGPNSADYSLIRLPIGGCDFSEKFYTYQKELDERCLASKKDCKENVEDFELKTWKLTDLDFQKLNFIKEINEKSGNNVKYLAAPWSPPLWMKNNHAIKGWSKLKGTAGDKYHKTWANYLVKFLKKYADNGCTTEYLSSQNEPSHGYIAPGLWNTLGWKKVDMRDWINRDLAPALDELKVKDSRFSELKLMIHDDVRLFWGEVNTVLDNDINRAAVAGIGMHWYRNNWLYPANILDKIHKAHPSKFIMATEACHEKAPLANSTTRSAQWKRAALYSKDIIENLNHWSVGWLDWNLWLDERGGPNWAENHVDSPVLISGERQEVLVQPMYWHMLHFSKLLIRGSTVLESSVKQTGSWGGPDVEATVATRPDDSVLITLHSQSKYVEKVQIKQLANREILLEPFSITSVLFYPE